MSERGEGEGEDEGELGKKDPGRDCMSYVNQWQQCHPAQKIKALSHIAVDLERLTEDLNIALHAGSNVQRQIPALVAYES